MREFIAKINLDEDVFAKFSKTNGVEDIAPGEHLEREFGWLEQSGLSLDFWQICDDDDELRWGRYITYLINWAIDHSGEEYEGMSPAGYDEWCENEDCI